MLHGLSSVARPAVALVLVAAAALGLTGAARAQAEDQLAQRYAPVVRLVEQQEECGPGEPYEPIDLDGLFEQDTVALRGPWTENDLIRIAPTAADLGKGLYEYNLDFPGDALNPGCGYERWARRITEGKQPTVYAHVVTEPGKPNRVALQYWLFYAFNDWNNNHEGDWEMVQLVFAAANANDALAKEPLEIGYSQHEGAEKADWGDEKLELVDGTHPVVYPAAGSHANFFEDALYIGRSANEGVGCDDTTGPSRQLRPVVQTIPSDPAAARKAFPWIAYQGRWGERRRAFLNGPTGPNLKSQWTEPITWAEDWRDRSVAIPAGGALGTGATDFFCEAVAGGSNVVLRLEENPEWVIGALLALVLVVVLAVRRTTWHPTTPLAVARRRSWGQTLTAAGRLYGSRPLLFLGIGLVALPISLVVTLVQALLFSATTFAGISPHAEGGGFRVGLAVAIGTVLTLLGLALVQAATARALAEIDSGREVGVPSAYRLSLDSFRPLLGTLAIAVGVVSLLSLSFFLIPIAVWLAVRWALIVPVAELEDRDSPLDVLRRSGSLVRHQWLKVGTLVVAAAALAIVAGPLLGALLLFVPGAPIALVNVVAGLTYAVAMPFVGLTTTYVYYDTLIRERLAPATAAHARLPAEI
jgi:hypothetical protein